MSDGDDNGDEGSELLELLLRPIDTPLASSILAIAGVALVAFVSNPVVWRLLLDDGV